MEGGGILWRGFNWVENHPIKLYSILIRCKCTELELTKVLIPSNSTELKWWDSTTLEN